MRKPLAATVASFLVLTPAAAGEDWPVHGGTQDGQRFSPINQINDKTVSRLGLAWSQELGTTRGLEATPLVEGGVIYTTGSWSVVFTFDAKAGRLKWTYDPRFRGMELISCAAMS